MAGTPIPVPGLTGPLVAYVAVFSRRKDSRQMCWSATTRLQFLLTRPAVAKAAAFWEVANYREAYGLFACSGLLFNHESCLRPARFVTQKIITGARRIASGEWKGNLHLGNLEIERDWGWAAEFVEAMALMLRQPAPDDYVIATGETRPLRDFVAQAFGAVGLDWQQHVEQDPALLRPTDLRCGRADPGRAAAKLGWRAKWRMNEVVRAMTDGVL